MRAFFYITILLLITVCAGAQQAPSAGSGIGQIQQIKNDTLRMDSLYRYADDNLDRDPKEAINAGEILLKDATAHNYQAGIANANYAIARGYEYLSDYPQSLNYFLQALRIQKEQKLYSMQINSMLGISRVYDNTGDFDNEKKYVEDAMAICGLHKTIPAVRKAYVPVLDYLATIYKKEGRYDTSITLYKEAIALARADSNVWAEISSSCNMAIALKSNKNYEASLAAYNHALSLLDTVNETYSFAVITDNMAILFYQMGDLARSEQYSLKAMALVKASDHNDVLRDAYDNLKNTYQAEKKYPEAFEYLAKWSAIKDTIFDHDKMLEIKELQTKYDTKVKDKQIADQEKELAYDRKITLSLSLSSVLLLSLGLIVYRNYNSQKRSNALLSKEKKRSEDLLLNILPSEVAEELKNKGIATAKHFEDVTVMFTDFVNFTQATERMTPAQLIDELHFCFKAFDGIIEKYGIEKIKTIGDAYLAVSGLPAANPHHAGEIVKAAVEINAFVSARTQQKGDSTFQVRIGVHSGNVVAGIVGVKKFSYDIWGDTVNTAARMEQSSEPGRINISQTTYDLIKDKFACTFRGEIDAKNKGKLGMYFVDGTKG